MKFQALMIVVALMSAPFARADADDLMPTYVTVIASAVAATVAGMQDEGGRARLFLEQSQADAALFLASGGSAEPGAALRELFQNTRARAGSDAGMNGGVVSDLEIAEAILAAEVK